MTASLEQNAVSSAADEPALLTSPSKPDAIRVLLIEDDTIDRGFLTDELSKQGFAVRRFEDGASLLGALDAIDTDVIVLHWSLRDISGIDLLTKLRRQGVNVPIVLLTGQALPAHECLAFDRGAVDVICTCRGLTCLARHATTVGQA